jgi:hypothetical protein
MSIGVPWLYIGHSRCIYDVNYTTKHKNRKSSCRKQSLLPKPIWQSNKRLTANLDSSKIRLCLVSCAVFILYTASISSRVLRSPRTILTMASKSNRMPPPPRPSSSKNSTVISGSFPSNVKEKMKRMGDQCWSCGSIKIQIAHVLGKADGAVGFHIVI